MPRRAAPVQKDAVKLTMPVGHIGLGVSRSQQEDNSPPPRAPRSNRGRPLLVLQGIVFLGGQNNMERGLTTACHGDLLPEVPWEHPMGYGHAPSKSREFG